MTRQARLRLEPQTGCALRLDRGHTLRVRSPTGEQVADVVAFAAAAAAAADARGGGDPDEWLSSGRTFDYGTSIYVGTGSVLYSNRSTPMLTVTADTAGRHDFLLTPCSEEMFERLYGVAGHPSCLGNLAAHLAPFGIPAGRIPTTLNLFMVVTPDPATGRITIGVPSSRPGDHVDLRAETDLIVGVAACSAELTNNGTLKPIEVEVHDPVHYDGGASP
ncbi:MAG: urea carboxylase-associated family protein [Actinomycetota bacterium]|nr:urea carboxylase-associated family protein [Actinomycetota bacterium]